LYLTYLSTGYCWTLM